MDLAETFSNLAQTQYPNSDIYRNVQTEINGENSDKTLYDIHFEKYKKLLDCYSLQQLKSEEFKQEFPELQGVISEKEVDAMKGSFIDDYRSGQYEIFNNDEDLTLQLIKLYWGQGFSLSDLSKYIAQNSSDNKPVNLYYTMKKLNIPMMNSKYASVLKLSNKEYNEKFSSELSIKLKEAREIKAQKKEGEAVVIPRGELSQAHKQHISEGLKKHFQEHPEKLLEMSERQKKFYEENPKYKEELSIVMNYAWNKTQEGKSVAKHLSKFLKKFYSLRVEPQQIAKQIHTIQSSALKDFWDKNKWAKTQFSIAAAKGWEYLRLNPIQDVKETKNQNPVINFIPTALREEIIAWAKKKGYRIPIIPIGSATLYKQDSKDFPKDDSQAQLAQKILNGAYSTFKEKVNLSVTAKSVAIISIENDLKYRHENLPDSIKNNEDKIDAFAICLKAFSVKTPLYDEQIVNGVRMKVPKPNIDVDYIDGILLNFAETLCKIGCSEMIDYINAKIDEAYEEVLKDKNHAGNFERFLAF
ncbi:MAG: hypothetical protein IJ877_08370 [Candidatus Gastranaerophilales bacterium]|nr:hypothetical protein [Candidatus Gastranaerophilales bacterium]